MIYLKKLFSQTNNLIEELNSYFATIDETDSWLNICKYKVDIETVDREIRNVRKYFVEKFSVPSPSFREFDDDFESEILKFKRIDSSMQVEHEYVNDVETCNYIYKKQKAIISEINDYYFNKSILEKIENYILELQFDLEEIS